VSRTKTGSKILPAGSVQNKDRKYDITCRKCPGQRQAVRYYLPEVSRTKTGNKILPAGSVRNKDRK